MLGCFGGALSFRGFPVSEKAYCSKLDLSIIKGNKD